MNDEEKIRCFADMVDGVERLAKPIQEENQRLHEQMNKLHKQMWWERIVWGIVFLAFILLAYLSPVEMEQGQDMPNGTQNQTYSEGAAHGG